MKVTCELKPLALISCFVLLASFFLVPILHKTTFYNYAFTGDSLIKALSRKADQNDLKCMENDINDKTCPFSQTSDDSIPTESFGIVVFQHHWTAGLNEKVMPRILKKETGIETDLTSPKEAGFAITKAKELASQGKRKQAKKLFEHALSLKPKSIVALNSYGEFLEDEDVVKADLLFQRTLSYQPGHKTAIANRQRTAPLVAQHDKLIFDELDSKKAELYKFSAHHPTLRSYMKESYYHHVFHTVALEGNKLTLEEMRYIIDHRAGLQGKSLNEHNEVLGLSEALQFVNNTLLLKNEVTVQDIKNLHKRVMGRNDPVIAGEFRSSQVFVGNHIPPDPLEVEELMLEFERWLNSDSSQQLHPVERAALAHYRFVFIHPFLDGNGRTGRLLMNLILMKEGIPPVSIQVRDRWTYYQTLTQANEGDVRPFVRFVATCTRQTLDDYLLVARLPRMRVEDKNRKIFQVDEKEGLDGEYG